MSQRCKQHVLNWGEGGQRLQIVESPLQVCEGCRPGWVATYWTHDLGTVNPTPT